MKTVRHKQAIPLPPRPHLAALLPEELRIIENPQTAIPAIAKDSRLGSLIANLVMQVPTEHTVLVGDARDLDLPSESVHLIVTSPPYWTLKKYPDSDGQLGDVQDYDQGCGSGRALKPLACWEGCEGTGHDCQPDSGKQTVRDDRGACENVGCVQGYTGT